MTTHMAEKKDGPIQQDIWVLLCTILYFQKTRSRLVRRSDSFYILSRKSQDLLFAERFRKIHSVTVPTPPFQASTMTLHIKLFMSFPSLAGHSPESRWCCTIFLSQLDMREQLVL